MLKSFVVDDENWVVESIKRGINWNKCGFELAGWAFGGRMALEEIIRLMPDVVITDIRMPDMDGIELIRQIRKFSQRIQLIIVSGFAEFEYAKECLKHGAVGYCIKPIDEDELEEYLRKAAENLLKSKPEDYELANIKNNSAKQILEYVNANYRKDLNIQNLAARFYINPNYMSHLFSKETGETFSRYINRLRINYACKLLRKTEMPVGEVAAESGYNDYFHFCKVFRKVMGRTPSQIREAE